MICQSYWKMYHWQSPHECGACMMVLCAVRDVPSKTYHDCRIGRGGPTAWPPRSPDLNSLDFYLWGHLKTLVLLLTTKRHFTVALWLPVRLSATTPASLNRWQLSVMRCAEACIKSRGHFALIYKCTLQAITHKVNVSNTFIAVSLPSIVQHTSYCMWHETYIHLTKMSLKLYIYTMTTCFGLTGNTLWWNLLCCARFCQQYSLMYVIILSIGVLRMSVLFLSAYCGFSVPLLVCCSPGRVYLLLIWCSLYKKLNVSLVSSKIKTVLRYRRKRNFN
jgi:hypothetical protein